LLQGVGAGGLGVLAVTWLRKAQAAAMAKVVLTSPSILRSMRAAHTAMMLRAIMSSGVHFIVLVSFHNGTL
jgi:hypothetical protein